MIFGILQYAGLIGKVVPLMKRLLMLAVLGVSQAATAGGEATTADEFDSVNWRGYNASKTLTDDTRLNSYIAETTLVVEDHEQIPETLRLRIQYFPRFRCSPLIGIYADSVETDKLSVYSEELSSLEVSIDNEPVAFPVMVEFRDGVLAAYYDADFERRKTFRILTDIGSRMQVTFKSGNTVTFSLLGSRVAVTTARDRCKAHN